ncbi:unnamed protein product [Allacma fusca]|uniref:Gustatory receptor n=1 Tax=Allacma fusca TaxID=39272 RepID=A0A8J2JC47_9HEXA|nr:unnamed protein product [Allacma fusca]
MVLPGFIYASWIGWISGSFFVSKPWGDPSYKWLSLYTLYALIFNALSAFKWIHFINKSIVFFQHRSLASKILNLCLLVGSGLFGLIFKLIFFIRAKKILAFLQQLRNTEILVVPEVQYAWKWCKVLICVTCISQMGTSVALPFFFYRLIPDASLSFIISPYYFLSFFIFGSFPVTACFTVAFVFAVVVTFHWLFCIEKLFADLNTWVDSKSNTRKRGLLPNDSISLEVRHESGFQLDFSKEEFIRKIENLQTLCKQFDEVVGPMYLCIFIRTVFFLIHSADAILIENTDHIEEFSDFKRFFGWIHLIFESSQLFLIFMGSYFHERVAFRRQQLKTSVFLHPLQGKREIDEIWEFVRTSKWKMTACGIFIIDKPLIGGVVSTMMTYVVILFQINLSDPGTNNGTLCTAK